MGRSTTTSDLDMIAPIERSPWSVARVMLAATAFVAAITVLMRL